MHQVSPYGPDRSLLVALVLLAGGAVLGGGGLYVLSSLDLSSVEGGGYTGMGGQAPAAVGHAPVASRRPRRSAPPVGGGVPAWARTTPRPAAPPRLAPQSSAGSYRVDPDFGHAELGALTAGGGPVPGGGAAIAEARERLGAAPQTGSAPLSPDLGGGVSGDGGSEASKAWRSEARTLASRTRALSRRLGALGDGRGSASSRSSSQNRSTPAEASTASGARPGATSGPGVPDDPDQVPLGGTEWLAAAGAAYALNRLRKHDDGESEET